MADRKRILIADDDPDLLDLLKFDLSHQGYEVLVATNGKDALAISLSDHEIDVALLDVMMPYIDGYHVAYEITSKLGPKAPRIVIMTSRDTEREKGVAAMSGAIDFIQKPFDIADLHKRLANEFEQRPQDATGGSGSE